MPNAGEILLADDDADFGLLLQTAFEYAGIINRLIVVPDGLDAIHFLQERTSTSYGVKEVLPLPSLVLLDLRLPRLSGFEVLRWIRLQPGLAHLRVAIFTGSEIENEARLARELGADAYLVKPFQFNQLVQLLEELRNAWLQATSPSAVTGTH